jgi:hypothetical protein
VIGGAYVSKQPIQVFGGWGGGKRRGDLARCSSVLSIRPVQSKLGCRIVLRTSPAVATGVAL